MPWSARMASMSRWPTGPSPIRWRPEPDPLAARADRRQQPPLAVSAEDDRDAGRRLLERLEQRGLGVLVHPVGAVDDGDAPAALHRHQGQLRDQVADTAEPRVRTAD